MISIKSDEEIKILREGGKKLASILNTVSKKVAPGVATIELDKLAEKLIIEAGGKPSFKNYKTSEDRIPFPATLCVSINDEVVHGIPSAQKILKNGDIVSLDIGMEYKKMFTDTCITVGVGEISENAKKIIKTCKTSLEKGIKTIKEGSYVGDIGFAVQNFVGENGYGVVRNLVGHGVGYSAHEEPEIPNYGNKGTREKLVAGMVLAVEPMITEGSYETFLDKDNWTWRTRDGKISAHFEHTVVVTKNGVEVLTELGRSASKLEAERPSGRFLGIDYGEKKVGLALSDENGLIAMPFAVLPNIGQDELVKDVLAICLDKGVKKIILGESKNFKGEPNPIMKEIEKLKTLLEKESGLPIVYHPEVLSTKEASRLASKSKTIDASAAAIVLQSFIDKLK